MPGAGAGRNNDVSIVLEYIDCAAGQGPGVGPEAGVEGGLSAARLRCGEVKVNAESLQHVDRAFADFGVKLVDDAGYEEGRPDGW